MVRDTCAGLRVGCFFPTVYACPPLGTTPPWSVRCPRSLPPRCSPPARVSSHRTFSPYPNPVERCRPLTFSSSSSELNENGRIASLIALRLPLSGKKSGSSRPMSNASLPLLHREHTWVFQCYGRWRSPACVPTASRCVRGRSVRSCAHIDGLHARVSQRDTWGTLPRGRRSRPPPHWPSRCWPRPPFAGASCARRLARRPASTAQAPSRAPGASRAPMGTGHCARPCPPGTPALAPTRAAPTAAAVPRHA